MAADKVSQPTSRDEFEIAIICTRALEYDAVCLLLDGFWDTAGDPFGRARGDLNTYTIGYMGKYNIVVVLLCNSGKANAAGAAASLRSSYPCIELLLLTGICEGVPDANGEELLLGDVVVSETVIQYDLGTQHAVGFKEKDTLEDRLGRTNKNIRNFIANVKTEMGYQRIEEKAAAFLEKIQSRALDTQYIYQRRRKAATYMYPGSVNDILFDSTHCHRHYNSTQCACADYNPDEDSYAVCDESRLMDCEQIGCEISSLRSRVRLNQKAQLESGGDSKSAQIPSICLGRFGSGDTAFKSGVHRDSLAKKHNVIAFEMEGAGVWDELPCIIVKGVSEYGDGHKTKKWTEWQNFAAATAASVARALVERYPQTDQSPAAALKLMENKACLNALFITNPEDDKQRIEETKGGLLLDAYIWIIRNKEFMQWLADPVTRLLWIKGDPGKGKTMMLCGIIDELKMTNSRGNVYYFLCQATDDHLNSASAILRGLLHMMILRQPSLISYVRNDYDKSGKSAFEGVNSWIVLSRMFEQMLKDGSLTSREPIFIIDALDECVVDSAQFLELIVRNSTSFSQAKWLVSSRNEADIQEVLATTENKSTVSLELNAESVSTAITTYIRHKVQRLAVKKGYKEATRESVEKHLSDNANGTFLWVALVCALLEKVPRSDPLPKSADFPPGLNQLYERMMGRVCDPSISDISRKILAVAAVACRPLTEEEFFPLINHGHDEETMWPSDYDWEDILGYCGSFLTRRNGTIYFVHQSAKDFLIKGENQRLFPKGVEYIHREILEVSIAVMRNILRKDMYNLVDPAFSIDNFSQDTLSDDPLIPARYGCLYWIDHFEQSIPKARSGTHNSSKNHDLIHAFLKEKFIYWLEALSLLRGIFDGMAGIQRLERLVVDSETSELSELVWDARKFIQTFGNAIADFPLQVYVSALVFSPTQSIIRCQFREEAPKWIRTLSNGEDQWAPSSRTYESSRGVEELAVSCCGTWIASSQFNATITIWETYSGKIIQVLNALPGVSKWERGNRAHGSHDLLVCFSPWNRGELVSSCCEYEDHFQLVVWDITSSKVSQQFQLEDMVISISYLKSESHILGFLSTKYRKHESNIGSNVPLIASIWNTRTGQIMKRVQLQETTSWQVPSVFSPTRDSTVAWYRGSHVEIINIDTGISMHILTDTIQYVYTMKFSPDSSFLALADQKVVILSDTSLNETKWSIQTEYICDLAFSPDGKVLAIATLKEIELLNTFSGKRLRKFIMGSKRLIFSSDGSKMFSAYGPVISVIDIGQESFMDTGLDDTSFGKNIVIGSHTSLSPNGRIVASVLPNRPNVEVMKIGLTNSTHLLRLPDIIQKEIKQLLFSPDSEKLVVVSADGFTLCDISSELARAIFMWEKPSEILFPYHMFVFSLDSQRVASYLNIPPSLFGVDRSFKVQVWDTGSGKCLMYLERKSYKIVFPLFCFSPDNERLIISYMDDNFAIRVEIWEILSNSVIQTIELNWNDLHNKYKISSPGSYFGGPPCEEDQTDEEVPNEEEVIIVRRKGLGRGHPLFRIEKVHCIDKGHLILDIQSSVSINNKDWGVRVALQTRDLELTCETDHMLRFREAQIYDVDSEKTWIQLYGKKLVWIPPQYRTDNMLNEQNRVVISHHEGSLSILQISHSQLIKQISSLHTSSMSKMPCAPNLQAFTYLRELDDGWEIVYRDMNAPDDKTMHKIESVDEIQDLQVVTYENIMEHSPNAPEDKIVHETESVYEVEDSSSEVAHQDITDNYSYWKWTIFGF